MNMKNANEPAGEFTDRTLRVKYCRPTSFAVSVRVQNKIGSPPDVLSYLRKRIVIQRLKPAAGDEMTGVPRNQWRFKILFDGECPLCRREARFLARFNRNGWLALEDITSPGFDPSVYGTTREELMGVIHGVFPDGRLLQRVAVFREAYRVVGLGWVLAPTGWPGLRWLADRGYKWFARNRTAIGKLFGRHCDSEVCVVVNPKLPRG